MNDHTHATLPAAPGELLRATMELRYLARVPYQTYPPATLQQKWISDDAQRFEWRDVPTVTAP